MVTGANADTGHHTGSKLLGRFCQRPNVRRVANLGPRRIFSLMAVAGAMVGNSSSGIVEAATYTLPVVNVGRRQDGRERAANVVDVTAERAAILAGIRRALSPEFADFYARARQPVW